MPDKKRFLKSVDVNFISLVDKGANQKKIIFKSADTAKNTYCKTVELKKVDNDQRMVYGIVYSPDEVDTEGDFTTAEVIKQMAHNFMKNRNTNNVDQQHDFNPDEGFVAESWIIEKNDPRFPGEAEGSWAVAIKVLKNDTWEKVKSGEITGLSMAGLAIVEELQKNDYSFLSLFKSLTGAIKQRFISLKKDFSSALNQTALRDYVFTLERAIDEIIYDETIVDKKTAIMESIDQFKAAMSQVEIGKSDNNINNKEDEMKPEEITKLTHHTITEALKPVVELQNTVNELMAAIQSKSNEIEKRLKIVEEKSPGSAQAVTTEETAKVNHNYKGPHWLS